MNISGFASNLTEFARASQGLPESAKYFSRDYLKSPRILARSMCDMAHSKKDIADAEATAHRVSKLKLLVANMNMRKVINSSST